MFQKKPVKYFDFSLMFFVAILITIGIFLIGSATGAKTSDGYYLTYNMKKQLFGIGTGFVLLIAAAFFNYDLLKKLYIPIYVLNLILLGLVLKIGVGQGVSRWIPIGNMFTIQPSEFAKIFIIIFLAGFLSKKERDVNNPLILLLTGVFVGIPILLVYKQPDLSTSVLLIGIWLSVLYINKLSYKYIVPAVILGIIILIFIRYDAYREDPIILKDYQTSRIKAYLEPEKYKSTDAYQSTMSLEAIGSGKLEGKGLNNGTLNKFNFLPEAHTDFIFSVIGEELGFIGCSFVIFLFFMIGIRCIWIAYMAPDNFGLILAGTIGALFILQSFVHAGVTTSILPNTGIPLPFVSYGISSLWANMIGVGLVMNVSLMRKRTHTRR